MTATSSPKVITWSQTSIVKPAMPTQFVAKRPAAFSARSWRSAVSSGAGIVEDSLANIAKRAKNVEMVGGITLNGRSRAPGHIRTGRVRAAKTGRAQKAMRWRCSPTGAGQMARGQSAEVAREQYPGL